MESSIAECRTSDLLPEARQSWAPVPLNNSKGSMGTARKIPGYPKAVEYPMAIGQTKGIH